MASQVKYKIANTVIIIAVNGHIFNLTCFAPTIALVLFRFQLYNLWHSKINIKSFNDLFECFSLKPVKSNKTVWRVHLPLKDSTEVDDVLLKDTTDGLLECEAVKRVTTNERIRNHIFVELDEKCFVKDVLESQPTTLNYKKPPKKIIVEFSSPNIAKHFHVGHLRSTIIGNCLANIKKKLGDDVIKMNYLGDWGTQLGLIEVGLGLGNYSEEDFKEDPLKVLLRSYIKGNEEAEKNPELFDQARKKFCDLEFGSKEITEAWCKYREWTINGLDNIYNRLGVSFDVFEWESNYNRKKASDILEMLEKKGILHVDDLGRKVATIGSLTFPLIKSDDTTLYLTRDLMALINRRTKYQFDEMYYVVDNGQSEHFNALKALSSELKIDDHVKIEHVKFGRIQGMSTRKGRFTPLSDVLDEAQERIFKIQLNSERTKVPLNDKKIANILGVSAVMINDLKRRRIKDYEFSWDETVSGTDNSGIMLQYSHCRLSNIQNQTGNEVSECDPEVLVEPEAMNLARAIARYEEKLLESHEKLEPCSLTVYLFELVKAINLAYVRLSVKRSDVYVAQQRDLLFRRSKEVLNEGMRLLGLTPLNKM